MPFSDPDGAVFEKTAPHRHLFGRRQRMPGDIVLHHRIGSVENENIAAFLVFVDAEFGPGVEVHLVLVAVEVVGGNVEQHRHLRAEFLNIFQLETADFQYVHKVFDSLVFQHQSGKTVSHIAAHAHIQTGGFQQVVREHRGGCFSVGTCDGHDRAFSGMPKAEFDFADDRNAFGPNRPHYFRFFRYSGAFDHLRGFQDFFQRMLSGLKRNSRIFQRSLIFRFDRTLVGHKHVIAQPFGQERRACSGFAGTENDYAFGGHFMIDSIDSISMLFSPRIYPWVNGFSG